MANVLENLLSQPVVYTDEYGALQRGLTGGIEAGFNLASKQFELQKQKRQLELDIEENSREAMLKAVNLIPKIKTSKGAERSLYLKYFSGLSKNAGVEFSDDLLELLNKSEVATTSLSSMVDAARESSGGDPVKFVSKLYDAFKSANIDPPSAPEIWKTIEAQSRFEYEKFKLDLEERNKNKALLEKNLSDSGASQSFREKLGAMPEELKLPASAAYLSAKKRLENIADKVFRDEKFMKNIPPAEQDAIRKLYNFATASIQDPNSAINADSFLTNLETSINNAAGTASQIVAQQEQEKENRLQNKERRQIINDAAEGLRKRFKSELETLTFASKAINILNNPDVAGTPLGADAVVSLLARYLDPKTGVKETEFNRIRKAAAGTTLKKIQTLGKSIIWGRVLDAEQRDIIRKLIKFEINEINNSIGSARKVLEYDLDKTDINPDHVLLKVFDINPESGNLKAKDLSDKSIDNLFVRDPKQSFSDWFNGRKESVNSAVSEGKLNPQLEAQIRASKSAISKLRGNPQVAPEQEPVQEQPKGKVDFNELTDEQLQKYLETGEL